MISRQRRARIMRLRRRARAEAWMRARREPLRMALAEIYVDETLAFLWLRYLLIQYWHLWG